MTAALLIPILKKNPPETIEIITIRLPQEEFEKAAAINALFSTSY